MKKIFVVAVALLALAVWLEPGRTLLRHLQPAQSAAGQAQREEWLSQVARQYYGDASYGKELALLNRVPDGHLIRPKEAVLVPSLRVVQQIRQTGQRWEIRRRIEAQELRRFPGDTGANVAAGPTALAEITLPSVPLSPEFVLVAPPSRGVAGRRVSLLALTVGVGGLALAYRLSRRRRKPLEVTVVEDVLLTGDYSPELEGEVVEEKTFEVEAKREWMD